MELSTRANRTQQAIETGQVFIAASIRVNFFVKKHQYRSKRKNGTYKLRNSTNAILCRVTIEGTKASERSTRIHVKHPDEFEPTTLTIKNDPINSARLAALKADIQRIFNERLYLKRSLNPRHISDMAFGLCGHDEEHLYAVGITASGDRKAYKQVKLATPNISGTIAHFVDQKARLLGNGIAKSSLDVYRRYGSILTEFVAKKYGTLASLESLTPAVEYELVAFLKGEKQLVHNYALKIIQFFKAMLTYAHAHRWVDRNVLAATRLKKQYNDIKTLSMKELTLLATRQFTEPSLNEVRDVFLFCCYTGLAYTDVQTLSAEHILEVEGIDCIVKRRNKSHQQAFIPLFPEAIEILNRYAHHKICQIRGVLLPVLSNQKMNQALKIIGNVASIPQPLHTHMARKTFTMFTEERGFGLDQMATMLGHSRTAMTERHYYKRRHGPVIKAFKEYYVDGSIKRLAS